MDTELDERHSHHEGSRAGLKPRPYIFCVLRALCGLDFSYFVLPSALLRACFVRFVVKFAFSSRIFWLQLLRATIFEITEVSAISEIFDCINHEQFVKRRPASKIVHGSRATCSAFQAGTISMLNLWFLFTAEGLPT
jgi:hypothetical protein